MLEIGFAHTYQAVKIRIVTGDITQMKVDAIVNPANSSMYMGGGVAGAIKRAGGMEIESEALRKAPVEVGEAIPTKAGRLPARFVIHTPTMTSPAMRIDRKNVQLAMRGALKCAQNLGIQTLAFPGLGTGVGGLSIKSAADVMMRELKEHLDKSTALRDVTFVGFRSEATNAFEKCFIKVFESVVQSEKSSL